MQGVTNTIAATCSADIGKAIPDKNTKAVSTVTRIIDGMGSVGASRIYKALEGNILFFQNFQIFPYAFQ